MVGAKNGYFCREGASLSNADHLHLISAALRHVGEGPDLELGIIFKVDPAGGARYVRRRGKEDVSGLLAELRRLTGRRSAS